MSDIVIQNIEELKNLNLENYEIEKDENITIKLCLKDEQINYPINIYHKKPNLNSLLKIKIALFGKSNLQMPVEIHVKKGAVNTSTKFSALVYIMSNKSKANVTPGLFIEEKDIASAGHGVVIKNIKDEDLFYIRSRGITKTDSKNLIIGM